MSALQAAATPRTSLRIACVGGGPGGLSFAKAAADAGHRVTVYERREAGTYGLGVGLWPDVLDALATTQPALAQRIVDRGVEWRGQDYVISGRPALRTDGHGWGISRSVLLDTLEAAAIEVGVTVRRGETISSAVQLGDADLIVIAEGASSPMRDADRIGFRPHMALNSNRYGWFELDQHFDSFAFRFAPAQSGWIWAHCYPHRPGAGTAIIEMSEATWLGCGFDRLDPDAATRLINEIFAGQLDGAHLFPVVSDSSRIWGRFREVSNGRWVSGNVVLLGDSAHTTHFSIGSGTRLAMEDGLALAAALDRATSLAPALSEYERIRRSELALFSLSARRSLRFFERLTTYIDRPTVDFVDLVEMRRSRFMPYLPPTAYLGAMRLRNRFRRRVSDEPAADEQDRHT